MPTAPPSSDVAVEARVFWLRFQKEIATAVVIVILAIVECAGYRCYTSRRNSTAAELLGNAKTPHDYQEVSERYAGRPSGASACLLWAETKRDVKTCAKANATWPIVVGRKTEK